MLFDFDTNGARGADAGCGGAAGKSDAVKNNDHGAAENGKPVEAQNFAPLREWDAPLRTPIPPPPREWDAPQRDSMPPPRDVPTPSRESIAPQRDPITSTRHGIRIAPKFNGKYRIPSARHPRWDYGSNAAYFVTICTKNRVPHFGTIDEASLEMEPADDNDCTRMHMTIIGEEARRCWLAIPDHFPFVILDAFVIMPDHVHGIIIINKPDGERVEWQTNTFAPQSKNLASIIRGFKIGVTKFARENDMAFEWQARYHDRIVREDDNIDMIRFYIEANPLRWLNGTKLDDETLPLSSH